MYCVFMIRLFLVLCHFQSNKFVILADDRYRGFFAKIERFNASSTAFPFFFSLYFLYPLKIHILPASVWPFVCIHFLASLRILSILGTLSSRPIFFSVKIQYLRHSFIALWNLSKPYLSPTLFSVFINDRT